MNAKQKQAVEILKNRFERKVQNENSFREKMSLEIKSFEVHRSEKELTELMGHEMVSVWVTMGYVGDEHNALMFSRDYWVIQIGKNGGFKTFKRNKDGKQLKTTVHGLDNCVLQGSYRI